MVDFILPAKGNNDFFSCVGGKVVKWVKGDSLSCRMWLIKFTSYKELPTLDHFFKELGNDVLITDFLSINGLLEERRQAQ